MTLDAKKHGKVPELAWIPVARCDVDRRYQRSMDGKRSQALIERLVDKWHWARCGCLLATRAPNDRFWLQDGQHRSAAAARLGITHLPALVSDDMSVEDQAAAFVGANLDRVALNQFALHHARTIAGDADALAIAEACREAGIRIPRYQPKPKEMKPGDTLAIGTIAALFKKHPREIVRLTLATVADALRGGAGMLRGQVFTAVAALLAAAPETERDDLARRIKASLTARAWSAIWTEVATRRAAGVAGAAAMEQVLREGLAPAQQRPAMPPPVVAPRPAPPRTPAPPIAPPRPVAAAPAKAPPPSKPARVDDAAIAAHIAAKGVTRVDTGAAPDVDTVMNEARRSGAVIVAADDKFKAFRLDGSRTIDRAQLLARANRSRRERGLPDWREADVRWVRPPPPEPPGWKRGERRPPTPVKGGSL